MRRALLGVVALSTFACAGAAAPRSSSSRPHPSSPPPRIARWFLTERASVVVDEGAADGLEAHALLADGVRLSLRGGEILAAHPSDERLRGFRALPDRLGGGYVFWSSTRTLTAPAFAAELHALVDAPASGGARPWLDGVLLRTDAGLLELDPRSGSLRRSPLVGVAEAFAIDARRAARVDLLGRASVTTDGGATWLDLEATRGELVDALRPLDDETVGRSPLVTARGLRLHATSGAFLDLEARGDLHPELWGPRPRVFTASRPLASPAHGLASARLADAVVTGVPLDDDEGVDRVLVGFDGSVAVVSLASGALIAERALPPPDDEPGSRCEPLRLGQEIVVACEHANHARVYALRDPAFELEASFDGGGPFVFGGRDRFGRVGACGPALRDRPSPPREDEEEVPADHPAAASVPGAKYCARLAEGRWIDRELPGVAGEKIIRWTPGADGGVTAIVVATELAEPSHAPGVRVIRVRTTDAKLEAGALRVRGSPIDADASLDDDGSVRTWFAEASGGFTSARIDERGVITKTPAPEGVTKIGVHGRFALAIAVASGDRPARSLLSRDAGATYRELEAPPGGLDGLRADPIGCSDLGCAWGSGLVRVGLGLGSTDRERGSVGTSSTPPGAAKPAARASTPARGSSLKPRFSRLRVACKPTSERQERAGGAAAPRRVRLSLSSPSPAHPGAAVDVLSPFDPAAAARTIALPPPLADGPMSVPILGPRGVELLLFGHDRAIRVANGPAAGPWIFDGEGRPSIAAELGAGLVLFDADRALVQIARPSGVALAARLVQLSSFDRTRLTLGRRRDGGVAIVGYSVSSGDVWAGALDLVRAEVAPLAALAPLDRAVDASRCSPAPGALSVILDLPIALLLEGRSSADVVTRAVVRASVDREHVCIEALEVTTGGDRVVARYAPRPSSSIAPDAGPATSMSCALSTELEP